MIRRVALSSLMLAVLSLALPPAAAMAAEGDNFFVWKWGGEEELQAGKVPRFEPVDRIGQAGTEGDIRYRLLKPNTFQVMMIVPAFDFDAANNGAINHPFYVTVRFKDISTSPTAMWSGKGGCGFYGAGPIGGFGGAGDGKWKDQTLVIPRSMMRAADGKTFALKITGPKAAVPIASLTLFSAETRMEGAKERIAAAHKAEADKRDALRRRLLPQFKDLGLPDPGPCPDYTAAEKNRGFRVFFPPVSRQLFGNSQPQEGELTDSIRLEACPGQYVPIVAAVRGLKDLGQVTAAFSDLPSVAGGTGAASVLLSKSPVRWAVYSEQRIGSSWGKDYRVCPEQLAAAGSHEVKPERLEIAYAAVQIPASTPAGDYRGALTVSSAAGRAGRAEVPVTLTVYPFALQRPEHSTHGQFYYTDYGDLDPMEIADMAEHGMDTVVTGLGAPAAPGPDGKRQTEQTRRAFAMLKKAGYRAPLMDGVGYINGLLKDEKNRRKYTAIIAETLGIAKDEGFAEMGFFPVDEPHSAQLQQLALTACTWIQDVPGARTYITSNPNAVKVLDPALNYVCYNLSYLNADTIRSMKPHQTLMFYAPSFDVNPEYNRYRPGFYQFRIGAYSSQWYAYMEIEGDPLCDLDGGNRDWTVVYPSMDSPTHDPTLEWEAMREGVYDWRYCYTLQTLAEQARKAGKAAQADQAMKVLQEVLSIVDVDGNKAGGPAIAIEADVRLKDKKLDPKQLAEAKALFASSWYDQSRRKIAAAIVELKKAVDEK
jgi:hypothetical protein